MNGQGLLRAAAIKTSRIWPFSALSRAVYQQAIRAFGRLCRRYPEIEAAYVRNSLAQGHWTAGSSDIDLTVLLRDHLTPDDEFTFLSRFWAEYRKLTGLFPMLGEVDVLTEEELPAFQRYGGSPSQPSGWLLICGCDILNRHPAAASDRAGIRALNDALWFYTERFLESLAQPRTFLRREHSARLARKIVRLSNASAGPLPDDPWLLVGHVQHAMERAACFLMKGEERELNRERLSPFGPCFPLSSGNIECACTSYDGRDFVIVRDGLDPATFASSLRADQAFWKTRAQPAVFLSRTLAVYLLRVARPFFLAGLQSAGAVSFGASVLPLTPEPTDASLRNVLLEQIPNLLLLPRRGTLLDARKWEAILLRLTTTMVGTQGALPSRNHQTLQVLARRQHSSAFERLREISSVPADSFPREAFCVYRTLSASLARLSPEFRAEAGTPCGRALRIAILGSSATAGAFAYPCSGLREVFYRASVAPSDSQETILAALVRTQPDVVIFDFIDETDGLPPLGKQSAVAVAAAVRAALPNARFVLHRAFRALEFVRELENRKFRGDLLRESAQRNRSLDEAYSLFEESVAGVIAIQPAAPLRAYAHHRAGLHPCHYTPEYDQAFLNELVERLR